MAVGPAESRGIPEELRARARAALAADRNVRAVLLYGSRARGDHRPESDWDIALVTRRGGWRLCWRPPAGWGDGPGFRTPWFLRLPEGELRRKKDAVGHPAFALARDGIVLAGSWRRPVPGPPQPVGADDHARILDIALRCLGRAVHGAGALLTTDRKHALRYDDCDYARWVFHTTCFRISRDSGWAASGLAVAALARFAKPGACKHPPERLARSISDSVLAAELARLGGRIVEEGAAGEEAGGPEDLRAAFVRIARIAERLPAELLEAARAPQLRRKAPGFALRQVRTLRWMATLLREARMEADAGDPGGQADFPVSAEVLADYDLMAPALEAAARGLMAVPRLLKHDMGGP